MTPELPAGWAWATLESLLAAPLANGRSVPTEEDGFPVLRLTAITGSTLDLSARKGGAWTEREAAPFLVTQGDFLVSRGNGSLHLVGRGALVRDEPDAVAFPDTMIRVRVDRRLIDPAFLALLWGSRLVRAQIEAQARTTAGIYKISQQILEDVRLPVPPLSEQQRIGAALDEQLAYIQAATAYLENAAAKATALRKQTLVNAVPIPGPHHWQLTTVGDAGTVDLGRQRHPNWHHGVHMRPYLRVANVFEDRIDTSDLMEMDFPPDVFERFRLKPGDILLNEGQSPEYLGRPALYRGTPENVAFTNSLLRFRAREGVAPEWALLVFRRHMHARRFISELRITTNIAHLSAGRFKSVEFPIPPIAEQMAIVEATGAELERQDRLVQAITRLQVKSANLREAVFRRAFTGKLVPQDADNKPAVAMLTPIPAPTSASPIAPVPAGIQEELPL